MARSAGFVPGVVLVGFRAGVSQARRQEFERAVGARWVRRLGYIGTGTPAARALERRLGLSFEVGVPRGTVLREVRRLEAERRWVRYAEPDYRLRTGLTGSGRASRPLGADTVGGQTAAPAQCAAGPTALVPDDPCFGLQWGDLNTGQTIAGSSGTITGTRGADDGVTDAWNVTTGSRQIVIGQVDTGVDATHPDLQANIWSNPNGILGCPVGTYGFTTMGGSTTCGAPDQDPPPPNSYGGHGTHVAGMMGAVGNNGAGVTGVNWQTSIMPVKWLDSVWAGGSVSDLVSALSLVVEAKDAGVHVRVVNDSPVITSQPSPFNVPALENELQALNANNILFVTSAGGAVYPSGLGPNGTGYAGASDASGNYPCAYSLDPKTPNVICATGTDQHGNLAFWADYGPDVQLAAPADNIYSTLENNSYGFISGGSMAAAQVSGAAALILSADPSMTMLELKSRLLSSATPIPLSGSQTLAPGGGALNICGAMPGCATATATAVSCTPSSTTTAHGSTCTATVSDTAGGAKISPAGTVTFTADATTKLSTSSCTLVANLVVGSSSCSVTVTPTAVGSHGVTATYGVSVSPAASQGSTTLAATTPSIPAPPPPHVVLPPSNTVPPSISGSAFPGRSLVCQPGTWSNSPTGFTYQWTRNGAPIMGAARTTYTVQMSDEGAWLNCTVTATNSAGQASATAGGNGRAVAVAGTLGCPTPRGRLHGGSLGPLSLGLGRGSAHRRLRLSTGHGALAVYCLRGGWGIEAIYLSGKRLVGAPGYERAQFGNRIVLLLTSNPHYGMSGVRPGTTLGSAQQRRLKLGRLLRIGNSSWYVSHGKGSPVVLQVKDGTVVQIGIAERVLIRTAAGQRRLLSRTRDGILRTRR